MWYVYFLKSKAKQWYYVGSTNRLSERIKEHNKGKVQSTRAYTPLGLVHREVFESESEARSQERMYKQKRIAKEAIISKIEDR